MLEIKKKKTKKWKKLKKKRVGARFVHNTRYKTYLSITMKKLLCPDNRTAATQTKVDKMPKDTIMRDINIKIHA